MVYHILPINDLKEHEEETTCECMPSVEFVEGGMIVIHNSFDGRELHEAMTQEEQLNKILDTFTEEEIVNINPAIYSNPEHIEYWMAYHRGEYEWCFNYLLDNRHLLTKNN